MSGVRVLAGTRKGAFVLTSDAKRVRWEISGPHFAGWEIYHLMQKHWDVMRSDDAGESWHEVSGNLPTDFGFPIDVHAHEPDTVYVVPITSDAEHFPPEGKLRVYRSRTGGDEWEALTSGLPQRHCYVNVLRDAMAVD